MRFVATDAGVRLDVALGERPEIASRAAAQRLIRGGGVTVNGRPALKRQLLDAGDVVEVSDTAPAPAAAPAVDVEVPIVYEDDDLIVVDKPAGLVVHPAPAHPTGTLVDLLRAGDSPRAGIVHRLDRDTSGLMIVAKNAAAHAALERMIRAREVRREYLALVSGQLDSRTGTIDAPIGRDRRDRTVHSTRTDRPRVARTHFAVVRAFARTTLVRATLETGRTHQIRAHMAAIGHPVCGDERYGGGRCGERLGLMRQFLHSTHLSFAHPVRGAIVECESNLPVDLRHASDAASREPASEGPDGG